MRRNRLLVVASLTVVVIAGGWFVWHRWSNSTTPISVDELAQRAAASTSTTSITPRTPTPTTATTVSTPPPLPQAGVYAYDTHGTESLDVLDGVERTYPTQTGVVVSNTACGVDLSWQPYVERTYTISLCAGGDGLELAAYANEYEFYGNTERRRLVCDPPIAWQPPPGAALEFVCAGDDVSEHRRVRATTTTLTIDGQQREVTRLVVDAETTGSTEGTTHEVLWIDAASGMLLRLERIVSNASATPVGSAHYDETVTLTLQGVRSGR